MNINEELASRTDEANGGDFQMVVVHSLSFDFQQEVHSFVSSKPGNWIISHHTDVKATIDTLEVNKRHVAYIIAETDISKISETSILNSFFTSLKNVPILAIAYQSDLTHLENIISSNISGFINPKEGSFSIGYALRAIDNGGFPISPSFAQLLLPQIRNKAKVAQMQIKLTPQQLRILTLINLGKSYMQIADDMNLSVNTIHTYSRGLFKRLNVHSKTEAIYLAKTAGLI